MNTDNSSIAHRPVELLQQLIRFNTTNPPGNEADCITYINTLLTRSSIHTSLLAKDPARPNLVARIAGRGEAAPLLVYAHIDVATTQNQTWKYPPFEAQIAEECIWGRGALDDKNGAAMSICAFLRMKEEGWVPPGDVILTIVCDEELGGEYGSGYLIDSHPDLFTGVRYAIGEVGGFAFYIGKQKFYPIMLTEKQYCIVEITVRSPAQYGTTTIIRGGTAAKTGALLTRLDQSQLPTHITPVARQMVEAVSSNMTFPNSVVMRQLLRTMLTDRLLGWLGKAGQAMFPLFHNTSTVINIIGGEQVMTAPEKIVVTLGLSLLPGFSPEEVIKELHGVIGIEYDIKVVFPGEPGPSQPNMGLFDTLCQIIREADPEGVPIPLMLTAPTDARLYNRLGIQTYGFQPIKLPPDIQIEKLAHMADERIPLEAVEFGTEAIYKLFQQFH